MCPTESVALTVNAGWPAAVGVPASWPSEFKPRPPGSSPALMVHWYGGVPPLAPKNTGAKAMPTSPLWNGRLVIVRGEATGGFVVGGDVTGAPVGVEDGMEDGLDDGLADGLVSGELEASWVG